MITDIMKFQTDRELHLQEYNENNEAMNIFEEVFEAWGYNIPKEKRKEVLMPILWRCDVTLRDAGIKKYDTSEAERVDAYNDIIVFCIGAIMKLGYDPQLTLPEVAKEINSRKGEMHHGKFEKYVDRQHVQQWYKADFSGCKL